MREKCARAAQAAAFFALLLLSVALVSRALERGESAERIEPFLREARHCDVLFFGDSHVINSVYPAQLWRDYGIASYNLASFGNTMATTYWELRMALDFARPKLVVVDVDDIGRPNKANGSSGDLHNALDGYPLTLTKLRAVADLACGSEETDSDGERYADIAWEYVFKLGKYHNRWSELAGGEQKDWGAYFGGAGMEVDVADPVAYSVIDERLAWDQGGWGYDYLRKIFELCESRGIDVLLTNVPFPASEEDQEKSNAAWYVAQEYGAAYLDFVGMDSVADYQVDCYGPASHLNPSGAGKTTDFLGAYIRAHYDVPDRRGDAAYGAWEDMYAAYAREKLRLLREAADAGDARSALMLLHDADLSVLLLAGRGSDAYRDGKLLRLLQNVGRTHILEADAYTLWSDALTPLAQLDTAAAHGVPYFALLDRGAAQDAWDAPAVQERLGTGRDTLLTSFGEVAYESDEDSASLSVNGQTVFEADGGADLRAAAIDRRTGEIVAVMDFDVD